MSHNSADPSAGESFIIDMLTRKKDSRKLDNFLTVSRELKEKAVCGSGYPVWLTIDPTNICTLKCPFCSTGFGNIKRPRGMLSLENFKRIIDILGTYLLHIDMQNWGEPLLNKDVYNMIAYAKKFDIHITASTNFQTFDGHCAEDLVKSGLDRLIVSIDGASQETYEKYRRGGSFSTAIGNIRTLVAKKRELQSRLPIVIWQFLVFRHNEHEIETVKKMGEELGVDHMGINSAFIAVNSDEFRDWIPLDGRYSRYDLNKYRETAACSDDFLKPNAETVCNWLWQGMAINWDGSVSPCCGVYLEEDDSGNILDGRDFRQLWNNERYKSAREFVHQGKKPAPGVKNPCVGCPKIGQINFDLNPDYWTRK